MTFQGLNAQTKTEVKASIELNKPTAGDNQITGYSGDEMTSFSRLHQIQALPLSLSEKNGMQFKDLLKKFHRKEIVAKIRVEISLPNYFDSKISRIILEM